MNRVFSKGIERFFFSILFAHVVIVAPLLAQERDNLLPPMLTIGRLRSPITLDGKLNDAAWSRAIDITPFVTVGEAEAVREPTWARVAFDNKALYVAFHCKASTLVPANNRLDDFKATATEPDSDTILRKDDCVVVLLAPGGKDGTCYDVFISAGGAVNDARCSGKDLWKGRDPSWNGSVRAVTTRAEGWWNAEIEIPFAALGAKPTRENRWGLVLGRIERGGREVSVWKPVEGGFHDRAAFFEIVFSDNVPGVHNWQMGRLVPGANRIAACVQHGPVALETSVKPENGKLVVARSVSRRGNLNHSFKVDGEGTILLRYSLRETADGRVLLKSPAYRFQVGGIKVRGRFEGAGKTAVFLNGGKIASCAGATAFVGRLVDGRNVLAVTSTEALRGEMQCAGVEMKVGSGWRMSREAAEGWEGGDFDDSDWMLLDSAAALKGTGGKPFYLRKTIYTGQSRVWPNWHKGDLTLMAGTAQTLLFPPQTPKGISMPDWELQVLLPEGIDFIGASGYYKKPTFTARQDGTVCVGSKRFRRFLVRANADCNHKEKISSNKLCAVFIRTENQRPRKESLYYSIRSTSQGWEEAPIELPVRIIPNKKGDQAKRLTLQVWTGYLSALDSSACRMAVLKTLVDTGFNDIVLGRLQEGESLPVRRAGMMKFTSWSVDLRDYVTAHPDEARVNMDGGKHECWLCPTLMLEKDSTWAGVEAAFRRFLEKSKIDHVCWDFEFPPLSDFNASVCFCPRCLERFRAFAGLAQDTKLSAEIIRRKHAEAWVDWACTCMARFSGRFREAAHRIRPGMIFSVYSGYQSPKTRSNYGVDWAKLADKIDLAMAGYRRPLEKLQATKKALEKTPLAPGFLLSPYHPEDTYAPRPPRPADLARRLTDGTGGVMLFSYPSLDGRTLAAAATVNRLAASCEHFFLDGKLVTNSPVQVKGLEKGNVLTYEANGEYLVLLINDGKKNDLIGSLCLRRGMDERNMFDVLEGKPIEGKKDLDFRIGPGEIRAYRVR